LAVMVRPANAPAPTLSTKSSPATTANAPNEEGYDRDERHEAGKPRIRQSDPERAIHRWPPGLQGTGDEDHRVQPSRTHNQHSLVEKKLAATLSRFQLVDQRTCFAIRCRP
jgi:hypothetical protein